MDKIKSFLKLFFLILQALTIVIPLSIANNTEIQVSNNQTTDSSISIVSQVTIQKCPLATFPEDQVKLSSHLLDQELQENGIQNVVFKLKQAEPECMESDRYEFSETLPLGENSENELNDSSLHPQSLIQFSTHGILTAVVGEYQLYREITDYCILEASQNLTVSFCQNTCHHRPCIPKCCKSHEVLDLENSTIPAYCSPSGDHKWTPKFYEGQEPSSTFLTQEDHLNIKPHVYYNPLNCVPVAFVHEGMSPELLQLGNTLEDLQLQNFRLLKDGSLVIQDSSTGSWTALKEGEYCVDGIQNYGKGDKFSGNSFRDLALVQCVNVNVGDLSPEGIEDAGKMNEIRIVIYWVTIPFASIFLLLTIIVYILVWDIHNIHGHTLFSYVCSLFGFYVFLFLSQIQVFKNGTMGCAVIGVGIHLLFLITACWLTTINFDVWWTFRILKVGKPSHNLKRYLCYTAFAVGGPLIIVIISVALNMRYKDDEVSSPIIIPNYGKLVCALSNASVGYYLYTPVGILIGCNIMFFLWTIFILLQYQRSIGAALKGTTSTKEDQSLGVFFKLFVVMGTSWIFEIIGWAVQKENSGSVGLSWFFGILDAMNLLLAVAIFFIFVWKRTIYEQLWLRRPFLRPLLSLCVCGGCCENPRDNQRPSFSAMTMSTLGRTGTIGTRKVSSDSVNKDIILVPERERTLSNASRTFSLGEKKVSIHSTMSTLSETVDENLEEPIK